VCSKVVSVARPFLSLFEVENLLHCKYYVTVKKGMRRNNCVQFAVSKHSSRAQSASGKLDEQIYRVRLARTEPLML
jgi:hypothetical protein